MKIVNRKISELIPAEYNPRKLTEKQKEDIKKSLSEFGVVDPVIINVNPERRNVIVGGHQRCFVWAEMGNETIPCVEVNLSLEKEKELNIRLNKNTGQFDFEILDMEFEVDDLIDFGFEYDDFPIQLENIEKKDFSDKEFKEQYDKINNTNCELPIVPEFFENHECFIIPVHNEIDEKFVRDIFGLNDLHISLSGDGKKLRTNVISVEKLREWAIAK